MPFRWLIYANPFYWGLSSFVREQTRGSKHFSGAEACGTENVSCESGQRFKCTPGTPPAFCLGTNGEEVLDSLHAQFITISNDNTFGQDFSIILVLGILLKAIHLLIIYLEQRGRVELLQPEAYTPAPRKAAGTAAESKTESSPEGSSLSQMLGREASVAVALVVSDVSVQLMAERGHSEGKYLLKSVSARADSGKLLGVMGPSGAGKSTLLNVLVGTPVEGATEYGSVTLNGQPLTHELNRVHVAYVEQHDTLWTFLTTREHMSLATTLYQGTKSVAEQQATWLGLMAETGLLSCADTRAGDDDHQGLSGGQRRRLSLAMAFAKSPSVVIADEPTTGLDSAAAVAIVKLMGTLVRSTGTANVTTIHQPSAAVYSGIDDLLLLSRGRTAYYGPANALEQYLESVKKPLPQAIGVAEHALDLFNADFVPEESVEQLLAAWASQAPPPPTPEAMTLIAPPQRATVSTQILQLLKKHATLSLRDPLLASGRVLFTFAMVTLLYIYALDIRYREQHDVLYVLFIVVLTFFAPGMMSMQQLIVNSLQWVRVKREIDSGMYGAFAYWVVFSVFSAAVVMALSFSVLLPMYALADFSAKSLPQVVVLLLALFANFDALAELLCYDGREMGLLNLLGYLTFMALGSGCFVSVDDVIWPFKLFYHIAFSHWFLTGTMNAVFKNSEDFSGAVLADNAVGFECDQGEVVCYGATGEQILSSLHFSYSAVDADVSFGECIGWMFLHAAVVKLFAMIRVFAETAPKKSKRIASTPAGAATETSKLLAS